MIIFDQFRVSDDGKKLYFDTHINSISYYDNVWIQSITIVAIDCLEQDVVINDRPSKFIYKQNFTEGTREVSLMLDKYTLDFAHDWNTNEIMNDSGEVTGYAPKDSSKGYASVSFNQNDFSHNLFFAFVECNVENINPCAPCSKNVSTGVTFDENMLRQRVMNYSRELADSCNIPKQFIDFILLWNAFKAAIAVDQYIPAIKYYCTLFGTMYKEKCCGKITRCGCHG